MFTEALTRIGLAAPDTVMVGDDLESDVLGAQAAGITGVLVRTGKFRPETLAASADRPDHVLDTVADLPRWLGLGSERAPSW
jgi:ribonucleotide monophosphatase NagD (HAD superfamily)